MSSGDLKLSEDADEVLEDIVLDDSSEDPEQVAEVPVSSGDVSGFEIEDVASVSCGDADYPYDTVASIQIGVESLNANVVKIVDLLQVIVAVVIILIVYQVGRLLYRLLDIFW